VIDSSDDLSALNVLVEINFVEVALDRSCRVSVRRGRMAHVQFVGSVFSAPSESNRDFLGRWLSACPKEVTIPGMVESVQRSLVSVDGSGSGIERCARQRKVIVAVTVNGGVWRKCDDLVARLWRMWRHSDPPQWLGKP
jgi:hypothetical protein